MFSVGKVETAYSSNMHVYEQLVHLCVLNSITTTKNGLVFSELSAQIFDHYSNSLL